MDKIQYIPRRLIDLGLNPECSPRLIDRLSDKITEKDESVCKYATLSYCWGPREDARAQLKLTAETWERYRHAIPLDIMTPVMRDTVTVCRALQIRYVWIDALCIMQDNLRDWEEQSYQMSEIFGSSWLTICTIKASSCLEGFLERTENHETSPSLPYTSRTDASIRGSYILRRIQTPLGIPGGIPFAMRSPLSRDLMVSKWNERGWVFQEKNMSPRKAYFGDTMVHFQYKNTTRSQSGYVHDEGSVAVSAAVEFLSRFPLDLSVEAIASRGRYVADYWYTIVENFAGLQWTERLDIFPGLSGIARRFGSITGDRYAAGLWENDLHCGLLWRTTNWNRRTYEVIGPTELQQLLGLLNSPGPQLAPSWSWAGRENFQQFLCSDRLNTLCRVRTHLRPESQLRESKIQIDGVNPFGRLRNSSISLSGRVLNLPAGSMPGVNVLGKQDWKCRIHKGLVDILPDWTPMNAWDATGISAIDQVRLRLLLISSCCSEWQSPSVEAHTKAQGNPENSAEIDRKQEENGSSQPKSLFWGPDEYSREALAEGWLKPEYRRSFFQDGEPGFDPETDCPFCSDEDRRRDIWGLLIYPVDSPGTYYRVGAWYSRAEHGGSELFRHAAMQPLELV